MPSAAEDTSVHNSSSASTHANLVFAAAITAMALLPLAVTGTNLAFPEIERDFDGSSRAVLSWALSGYSITIAAFQLLGGQLSDRLDAKKMFLAGLFIFGAGSLLAGIAPNEGTLIAGRAVQGSGGALVVPASLVLATAQYPVQRHPFVIGVWTAAFPIGSAVAPSIAAVILEWGSWRWVFTSMAVGAGVVALATMSLKIIVPERIETSDHHSPDYLGVVIGTGAVGMAALGIVQGPSWGWLDAKTLVALGAALVLLPSFVARSLDHPRPLIDLRLFRIRTYSVAAMANVFISIAGMATWLIWPLVMTNQWGYSQITVGLAITPTPAIAGGISVVCMKWAQERGYRGLLITGSVMLVAANLWYVVALSAEPDYVGAMLPGLVLYGVGMGLTFAPVNAAALVDIDSEMYGQANAGFSTGRFLSGALGIAATIAALGDGSDPFAGYDRAFTLLAVVSVLSTLLLIVAWPRRQPTTG